VFLKEVLAQLEPTLVESNVPAVAPDEVVAAGSPNPEAEIVAENGADRRCDNHKTEVEPMRRAGIERRRDQHDFTGERDAHALDPDKGEHGPVAVGRQEMREVLLAKG
jgi:hypothetical protein